MSLPSNGSGAHMASSTVGATLGGHAAAMDADQEVVGPHITLPPLMSATPEAVSAVDVLLGGVVTKTEGWGLAELATLHRYMWSWADMMKKDNRSDRVAFIEVIRQALKDRWQLDV